MPPKRVLNFTTAGAALALVLLGLLPVGRIQAEGEKEPPYKLVVNAANAETTIRPEQLSGFFRKTARRWGNGTQVLPVDHSMLSPIRAAFSEHALRAPIGAIQNYWRIRLATSRELPPPVKETDDEVLSYVAANAGAIGYVSSGATLPATTKLLTVAD